MKIYLTLASILFLISCSKDDHIQLPAPAEPILPEMQYLDLQDRQVSFSTGQTIDIDGDGQNDFLFSTRVIGDPIEEVDKYRFSMYSGIYSKLLVSGNNGSPVLTKGEKISKDNRLPYEWYIISEVELAEKIISKDAPPFWRGEWKDASHRYIAVQLIRNEQLYNGWIELSIDVIKDKLILHRGAISKEADKMVKAGI